MTKQQKVEQIAKCLMGGDLVVLKTDTIYGILALASDEAAVEKLYKVRGREPLKACIVLTLEDQLPYKNSDLIIANTDEDRPTSVVVPVDKEPLWVSRGGETVAYRVVRGGVLVDVLAITGPVIAPSANPEGLPAANNIEEARAYFKDGVALYVDGGDVSGSQRASKIVKVLKSGEVELIRG